MIVMSLHVVCVWQVVEGLEWPLRDPHGVDCSRAAHRTVRNSQAP